MRRIRSKGTKPEMLVRRLAHRLGYRFRLHRKDLPGAPDLAFIARRKVIFVHGCFWHAHDCKRGARIPKTNADYWQPKLNRNVMRDRQHMIELTERGWKALVIWECELRDDATLSKRLRSFLGPVHHS